jgi:phosphatidylethanolamine/phosphatidyl-N-methylethanolamine N-methyltransferase
LVDLKRLGGRGLALSPAGRREAVAAIGRLLPFKSADALMFAQAWMRTPRGVGAIAPSGWPLAAAMAREVDPLAAPGMVVELGGGTGQFTRALLKRGVASDRLLVIERDAGLAKLLCRRFPAIDIVCDDACRLEEVLRQRGAERDVAAIVSGLPLLSLPREVRNRIAAQCFDVLAPGRPLVQFTYGPVSPVPRDRPGIEARAVARVLWNLPPATVWRYTRSDV